MLQSKLPSREELLAFRRSDDLRQSYRSTLFVLRDPETTTFRVDLSSDEADLLLKRLGLRSCAIITAHNPLSRLLTDEENSARHAILIEEARSRRVETLAAVGRSSAGDWQEESLVLCNVCREAADDIAAKFSQAAYLWCKVGEQPVLVETDFQAWFEQKDLVVVERREVKIPISRRAPELHIKGNEHLCYRDIKEGFEISIRIFSMIDEQECAPEELDEIISVYTGGLVLDDRVENFFGGGLLDIANQSNGIENRLVLARHANAEAISKCLEYLSWPDPNKRILNKITEIAFRRKDKPQIKRGRDGAYS